MSNNQEEVGVEQTPTKYKELSLETRLTIAENILKDIFNMNILPVSPARGNLYRYHKRFFKNSPSYKGDEDFGNKVQDEKPFN